MNFEKKKDYLICVDSDGTVMDTMTIKHERCFGPMFIKAMDIKEHQDEILNHWLHVNLYAITRGINRFQGFFEICEFIQKEYGISYEGMDEFKAWVTSTKEFSVNSIKKYMETSKDNWLFEKALEWSKLVNEAIVNLPPSLPFEGVNESLLKLSSESDIVGVSSANKEAVYEEWTRLDLMKYFRFVGCQDVGNKASIIKQALALGYKKENTIMLGDADGDLNAAKENGVWFFPIVPRKEAQSWIQFVNEAYPKLLQGKFNDEYQASLINAFYDSLK